MEVCDLGHSSCFFVFVYFYIVCYQVFWQCVCACVCLSYVVSPSSSLGSFSYVSYHPSASLLKLKRWFVIIGDTHTHVSEDFPPAACKPLHQSLVQQSMTLCVCVCGICEYFRHGVHWILFIYGFRICSGSESSLQLCSHVQLCSYIRRSVYARERPCTYRFVQFAFLDVTHLCAFLFA